MRHWVRTEHLVGSALVASLLLVGCNGQDGRSTSANGATTSTTEAEDLGSPRVAELAADIAVTGGPDWMVADDVALWAKTDSGDVVRIDPATNAIAATIPVGSSSCQGLGAGFGAIWACVDGDIVRIDVATNTVVATIAAGKFNVQGRLVTGFDRVWVLVDGGETLAGIDPATNAIATRISLDAVGFDLAIDEDSLWVAAANDAAVLRVDPVAGEVVARIGDVPGARSLSVAEAVWVVGAVGTTRIDRATNEVTHRVPVRRGGILATPEAVWVRSEGDAYLRKLDPATGEVLDSLRPPGGPDIGDVVVAFGSVWASSSDVSHIYRFTDS
jgi:streptogramin lyase